MSVYRAAMVALALLACGRATVDLRSSAQGEVEPLEAGATNLGPVLVLPMAPEPDQDASVSDFSPTGSEPTDPDRSDRDPDQKPREPEIDMAPPPMASEPPPYSDPNYGDPIHIDPDFSDPGPPVQDDAGILCSNDRECPGYLVCVNSRCEECRDRRQCYANAERSFCDEHTHTCVQCLDAFYCEITPGLPDACIDSTCQRCTEDWQCVPGHVCWEGECVCWDGDCHSLPGDIYSGDPGGGFAGGPIPDAGTGDAGVDAGRPGSSFP